MLLVFLVAMVRSSFLVERKSSKQGRSDWLCTYFLVVAAAGTWRAAGAVSCLFERLTTSELLCYSVIIVVPISHFPHTPHGVHN